MTRPGPARGGRLALALGAFAYAGLLFARYRSVPDGLVNDTAEEMLKGLALVEQRRFEVMTSALGYSAETLWLYVMGLSGRLLGPSVAAAVVPSAIAAVLTVVSVTLIVRELEPASPVASAFLVAAGSPWLYHYGRSGLRVAAAALFCALTGLLVGHACRRPPHPRLFFFAGAVAALGTYVYTACRALPVAVLAAVAWLVLRAAPEKRPAARRAAGAALLGTLLFSLPNLALLASRPREFLDRGRYVYVGSARDQIENTLATLTLPFGYPAAYRGQAGTGANFDADGVSATFSAAGLNPMAPWITLLVALGLVRTLRRGPDGLAVFLLGMLAIVLVVLAPAGPSLSRFLVLAPVLLVLAGRGAAMLATFLPWRAVVPLALGFAGAWEIGAYFRALGGPAPPPFVARAATEMGERARPASAAGPVLCVVSRDASVVRYLSHGTATLVVEFFGRPFDRRAATPGTEITSLLVERNPAFDGWAPDGFAESPVPGHSRFLERRATRPTGP